MKKFMKAIAFATVMCLVLSTVAFAAAEVTDFATKTVAITVEGVQKGEQVALVIVEAGAEINQESILFVDQKAAGDATASFNAVLSNTDAEAIDVYAGYASNNTASAVLVAENVELVEEEEVVVLTISLVDVQIVDGIENIPNEGGWLDHVADAGTKGAVVYFKINVANAVDGDITAMNWVFSVQKDGEETTTKKYAKADETITAALGSVLTGDVEIAAAFESTGYSVKDAWAAFAVKGEIVEVEKE